MSQYALVTKLSDHGPLNRRLIEKNAGVNLFYIETGTLEDMLRLGDRLDQLFGLNVWVKEI